MVTLLVADTTSIGWRLFVATQLYIVMSCLLYSRAFHLQVPITIAAMIWLLALHLPKTEASNLMAKFKHVDWAGAISLVLPLARFIQKWKCIVERLSHHLLTCRFPNLFHLLRVC